MKKFKLERIFEAVLIVVLLLLVLGVASPEIRNGFYKSLQLSLTPSELPTAIIHHITSGKVEFASSEDAVADIEIIGVNQVYTIHLDDTLKTGFVPAPADSDNGFGIPIDFIVDSLRFYSSDEAAGDSAIFTLYNTGTTIAVVVSGPDTLAVNGVKSYTGITATSRDFDASANEKFSVFVTVKGTYVDALVQIFGRSYDVR